MSTNEWYYEGLIRYHTDRMIAGLISVDTWIGLVGPFIRTDIEIANWLKSLIYAA